MEIIRGKILSVLRRRQLSDWGVADLLSPERKSPIKLVGNLGNPEPGQSVIVHGAWKTHPSYGEQFAVEELITDVPQDRVAIHKWLMITGPLTTNQASTLINAYGKALFETLEGQGWGSIHQLHKINLKAAERLHLAASEEASKREVFVQGMGLGLKAGELGTLWRRHFRPQLASIPEEDHSEAVPALWIAVTRDPWLMFFEYYFPFRRVASLAEEWKHDPRDQKRIAAAIIEALRNFARDGHVGAPIEDTLSVADALLYGQTSHVIARSAFEEALQWLIKKDYVVRGIPDTYLLLRYLNDAEQTVALSVALLLQQKRLLDEHRPIAGSGSRSTADTD